MKTKTATKSIAGALAALPLLSFSGAASQARTYDLGDPYREHGRLKENMTLVGTVTDDYIDNSFIMRARNGFTYRVWARWGHSPLLSVGDRVRAYGDWENGRLMASNVRVLRHGHPSEASQNGTLSYAITGEVVSNGDGPNGPEFVIRTRNGWTYPVLALFGEPANLTIGDRVRTYGNWRDGAMHARNIRLLSDRGVLRDARRDIPSVYGSPTVTAGTARVPGRALEGRVTGNLEGNRFTIRHRNGLVYAVSPLNGEPRGLSVGDMVWVSGNWNYGVLQARTVRLLRDG